MNAPLLMRTHCSQTVSGPRGLRTREQRRDADFRRQVEFKSAAVAPVWRCISVGRFRSFFSVSGRQQRQELISSPSSVSQGTFRLRSAPSVTSTKTRHISSFCLAEHRCSFHYANAAAPVHQQLLLWQWPLQLQLI